MLLKTLKIGNLSIQVPIIQGGMGVGISLSGLASAVANEGQDFTMLISIQRRQRWR